MIEKPPDDPIEIILEALQHIESLRPRNDPLADMVDRDRLIVAVVLGLLSDPKHHVGKYVGKSLIRAWIERGGQVPMAQKLTRFMKEPDTFEFACQYLHDYGLKVKDIAMALGVSHMAVYRRVWNPRPEDEEIDDVRS